MLLLVHTRDLISTQVSRSIPIALVSDAGTHSSLLFKLLFLLIHLDLPLIPGHLRFILLLLH